MADFKHPCLKPLGVHLKARVITLQNFCKISNFLQNLVLIPQHSPFPTVPLSHKNPQHYQRSEFAAAHSRKVDFAMAHSHLTTCIAPSLNPDRPTILRKSATFSNCKSAAHFRPPSTQLKPISIFSKGEFEAAHSHLTTCIAPSLNPDRSCILRKFATLSKVGIYCSFQLQLFG